MGGNGKSKVLIVDDRRSSRESVRFALTRRYECLVAESAEAGLEIIDGGGVGVVVLDIRMPGLSGIEALARIKQKDPTIEVVMLTGYASLQTAKESITNGAYGYLTKPFDLPDLRLTIDKAYEKRAQSLEVLRERDTLRKTVTVMQKEIGDLSRLADVGWLSAGIIHEMKSPLTAILGYAEMMLSRVERHGEEASLPPETARYLAIIKEETIRCAEMAKGLLEATRSNGHRPQPFPLSRTLDSVETLIGPQVHVNNIRFQLERPADDLDVFAEPDDVLQVLLNLLLNSIHVMNSDRGNLRIAAYAVDGDHPLRDSTPKEEDFLRKHPGRCFAAVEVHDSGPGIPPDQVEHVFDPFYTTGADGASAGLGLAISREKIERNSGNIGIVTSSKEGTTVRILLPRPVNN